jgi:hypothetical protein
MGSGKRIAKGARRGLAENLGSKEVAYNSALVVGKPNPMSVEVLN